MKLKINEKIDKGGYLFRPGVCEVPDQLVDAVLATGNAETFKETATRKTRTRKAVKQDADSDLHEPLGDTAD